MTKSQRKAQEGHLEKEKTAKPTNGKKSNKPKEKAKQSSNSRHPLKQTSPNTLNTSSPPLGRIYHVSSLNHLVSKRVLPTLCTFPPPLTMNSSNTTREKH
jgi:hypothetical protein